MKLEIKLENYKECAGCPMLYGFERVRCGMYNKTLKSIKGQETLLNGHRLEKCIKENGR